MSLDNMPSLISVPNEVHLELMKYLPTSAVAALSRVNTTLYSFYSTQRVSKYIVSKREPEKYFTDEAYDQYRYAPSHVVANPSEFSWFFNRAKVTTLVFLDNTFDRDNGETTTIPNTISETPERITIPVAIADQLGKDYEEDWEDYDFNDDEESEEVPDSVYYTLDTSYYPAIKSVYVQSDPILRIWDVAILATPIRLEFVVLKTFYFQHLSKSPKILNFRAPGTVMLTRPFEYFLAPRYFRNSAEPPILPILVPEIKSLKKKLNGLNGL